MEWINLGFDIIISIFFIWYLMKKDREPNVPAHMSCGDCNICCPKCNLLGTLSVIDKPDKGANDD